MQQSQSSNSIKSTDEYNIQQQSESVLKKQQSQATSNPKTKKKLLSCNNLLANISDTKYPVVKQVLKKMLGMRVSKDPTILDWDVMWTDNAVTPDQLAKMKPHQKINHFPGMFTLSRKNYLARNLGKMNKVFPDEYNFFPKTWILPSEYSQLKNYMESQTNLVLIAKPEASSQGKGIFLSKDIEDFEFGQHYVVQKYLKKPYLIDNLKFDLRIYVLVAGCDPLRVYIYKEGLARFATQNYQTPKKDNLGNLFMHLTNYSINKNSQKFQFNESHTQMDKGHKRSLTSIANHLGQKWSHIWDKIKDLIAKTLISTQPILAHHYRSCQPQNYSNNMCFQLLGFDVILDHLLEPYLLQVNYTPSFTTDTPLDKLIKQSLIRDSMIIMNLSNKAKNDSLNLKKRQMIQRTLTGKKIRLTKQQRQKLINKYQKKRDTWQNANLGNFDKVMPEKGSEQYEKIIKFLSVSQQLYENVTGANIRRNNKVVPTSIPQSQNYEIKQQLKLTNTQQLEKIYKTTMKPMKLPRKKESLLQKTQTAPVPSFKSVPRKPTEGSQATKAANNNIYSSKVRPTSAMKKAVCSNIYNISFKN